MAEKKYIAVNPTTDSTGELVKMTNKDNEFYGTFMTTIPGKDEAKDVRHLFVSQVQVDGKEVPSRIDDGIKMSDITGHVRLNSIPVEGMELEFSDWVCEPKQTHDENPLVVQYTDDGQWVVAVDMGDTGEASRLYERITTKKGAWDSIDIQWSGDEISYAGIDAIRIMRKVENLQGYRLGPEDGVNEGKVLQPGGDNNEPIFVAWRKGKYKDGLSAGEGATTAVDGEIQKGAIAFGDGAMALAPGAIQLGAGVNSDESSLQVGDYRLLDSDGKVPNERLALDSSLSQLGAPADAGAVGAEIQRVDSAMSKLANYVDEHDQMLESSISEIASKVPDEATSENQLADKEWVDDQIDRLAAYYITKHDGSNWASEQELVTGDDGKWYSGGGERTPTRNDYAVVQLSDGKASRWIYDGSTWVKQYDIETNDYEALDHKPSINDVELNDNKNSHELGLASLDDIAQIRSDMSVFLTREDFDEVEVGEFTAKKIEVKQGGSIEFGAGSSIQVTKGKGEATIKVAFDSTESVLTFPARDGELVVDEDITLHRSYSDWKVRGGSDNYQWRLVWYFNDETTGYWCVQRGEEDPETGEVIWNDYTVQSEGVVNIDDHDATYVEINKSEAGGRAHTLFKAYRYVQYNLPGQEDKKLAKADEYATRDEIKVFSVNNKTGDVVLNSDDINWKSIVIPGFPEMKTSVKQGLDNHETTIGNHTTSISQLETNKADKSELDNYATKDDLSEIRSDMSSFLTEADLSEVIVNNFSAEKIDVRTGGVVELNPGASLKVAKGQNEAKVQVVNGQTTHNITFPARDGELVVDKALEDATTLTERGFSKWTILRDGMDVTEQIAQNKMPQFLEVTGSWYVGDCHIPSDDMLAREADGAADALQLEWEVADSNEQPVDYTATRTALSGYQLGGQASKPLASEAEAEDLRTGKVDKCVPSLSGNVAALALDGNLVDSGRSAKWVGMYCTCTTSPGSAETKQATPAGGRAFTNADLVDGALVYVKFTVSQGSAQTIYLKVGEADRKPIKRYGTGEAYQNAWQAGAIVGFVFDAVSQTWQMQKPARATSTLLGVVQNSTSFSFAEDLADSGFIDTKAVTPRAALSAAQAATTPIPEFSNSATYVKTTHVVYTPSGGTPGVYVFTKTHEPGQWKGEGTNGDVIRVMDYHFDAKPTAGSNNLLASRAVYDAMTLTERGDPSTPGFSEWVCVPSEYDETPIVVVENQYEGGVTWSLAGGSTTIGDENSTSLTWAAEDNYTESPVTATRTALSGYQLGGQASKPLASEAEAEALRTEVSGKADKPTTSTNNNLAALDANGNLKDSGVAKSDVESLVFAQYYPDGNVKSAAEFTAGIKYGSFDTTNRTVSVLPFCNTDTAENDNSSLVGRVVIPPFVDANGNGYISDDGTRFMVTAVEAGTVSGFNTNLTAIVAPLTVVSIEGNAFGVCSSLASVSLPAVTSIVGYAFHSCTSLASVDFGADARSSVPTLGMDAFDGVPSTCKIIVPYTQYDAWIAAENWSTLPQEFVRHAEKADKPATFTAGNLAQLDENGNPIDSGKNPTDLATAEQGAKADAVFRLFEQVPGSALPALRTAGFRVPWGYTGYIEFVNGGVHFYHPAVQGEPGVDYTIAWPFKPGTFATTGDIPDVSGLASKASPATNNNLAALDANGNLKDSLKSPSDFLEYWSDFDGGKTAVTIGIQRGQGTVGRMSLVQGYLCVAEGDSSHAQGDRTTAKNTASHAEGSQTEVNAAAAHAEGGSTKAQGTASHSEGLYSKATGIGAHAEGSNVAGLAGMTGTKADGSFSHTEGLMNATSGMASHAQGFRSSDDGKDFSFVWQGYGGQVPTPAQMADLIANGPESQGGGAAAIQILGTAIQGTPVYNAKHQGSFCINPVPASGETDPASGFFVGNTSLKDRFVSKSAIASLVQTVNNTTGSIDDKFAALMNGLAALST